MCKLGVLTLWAVACALQGVLQSHYLGAVSSHCSTVLRLLQWYCIVHVCECMHCMQSCRHAIERSSQET
jgi:hypothetical protein